MSCLQRTVSLVPQDAPINQRKLADAIAYLSAALTNKNTCLEGLDSASGPLKPALLSSIIETYMYVSNALSILSSQKSHNKRRLMDMGVPTWISKKLKSRTRVLESEFDTSKVLTVAADGTGNFTTITDAINFAPNNSNDKTHIYVKQGLYEENVEIPSYKTHIVLLGDGADITTITGKRSVGDGWTTFRSATLGMFSLLFYVYIFLIGIKKGHTHPFFLTEILSNIPTPLIICVNLRTKLHLEQGNHPLAWS